MILVYELDTDYVSEPTKVYYKKATDIRVDEKNNLILSDNAFQEIAVIKDGYWAKAKVVKKKKLTPKK